MSPTLALRWTIALTTLAIAPVVAVAAGRGSTAPPDFLGLAAPHTRIAFVGTFHFADAGLDTYKPRFAYDPMTPAHQKEVEDLVARLADRFKPTKIAIEYPAEAQARLDSVYEAERKGLRKPNPNEITQIGFRLAKRLGLSRVYAIDAEAHESYPGLTEDQYVARVASAPAHDSARANEWNERYTRLYAWDDSMKLVRPLRETFLYMNGPERLRVGLGHYLVTDLRYGGDGEYIGADVTSEWWNRNLRIFSNLTRLATSPDDRILVLIGAGHVPILSQLATSSPEFQFVPLSEVLGGP